VKKASLRFGEGFRMRVSTRRGQAAEMVLAPGKAEGDPGNRHRGADQWLFVVSGTGRALVNGKPQRLSAGTLMLIEHGDRHEIRNTGRGLLRTLNLYVPPAYRRDGNPLPRGRK